MTDTAGNPFWMDSLDSWLPRLFRGLTMKVIPFSQSIGNQNVIVFPDPIAEIDTIVFLASSFNAALHCQMQAWTWKWASLSFCSFVMSASTKGGFKRVMSGDANSMHSSALSSCPKFILLYWSLQVLLSAKGHQNHQFPTPFLSAHLVPDYHWACHHPHWYHCPHWLHLHLCILEPLWEEH